MIRYGNRIHRPILFFILVLDLMDLIQCIELRETLTYYNPRVLSPPNLRILSLYYLDLQPISPKKKRVMKLELEVLKEKSKISIFSTSNGSERAGNTYEKEF